MQILWVSVIECLSIQVSLTDPSSSIQHKYKEELGQVNGKYSLSFQVIKTFFHQNSFKDDLPKVLFRRKGRARNRKFFYF